MLRDYGICFADSAALITFFSRLSLATLAHKSLRVELLALWVCFSASFDVHGTLQRSELWKVKSPGMVTPGLESNATFGGEGLGGERRARSDSRIPDCKSCSAKSATATTKVRA
jgi:hypothetical protein